MIESPYIIEHGTRKAIITGNRVQLFKVRPRNKKRPVIESVWPEIKKTSAVEAWNAGLLWLRNAYIETGERP